jgi:hypothetical protein
MKAVKLTMKMRLNKFSVLRLRWSWKLSRIRKPREDSERRFRRRKMKKRKSRKSWSRNSKNKKLRREDLNLKKKKDLGRKKKKGKRNIPTSREYLNLSTESRLPQISNKVRKIRKILELKKINNRNRRLRRRNLKSQRLFIDPSRSHSRMKRKLSSKMRSRRVSRLITSKKMTRSKLSSSMMLKVRNSHISLDRRKPRTSRSTWVSTARRRTSHLMVRVLKRFIELRKIWLRDRRSS